MSSAASTARGRARRSTARGRARSGGTEPAAERLREYRRKRDFDKTAEPRGGEIRRLKAAGQQGAYVMHKHAAGRLHFDLRLEHAGVLRSWALPKGPSLTPGERRLAVQVEDHPLEYGAFEGVIPAGAYGGGTVMLWDRGTWSTDGDPGSDQKLDIQLHGERLQGAWTLTRMHADAGEDGKNWLLIKRTDGPTRESNPGASGPRAPDAKDTSVLSGRTMKQIAADGDRTWTADPEPTPKRKLESSGSPVRERLAPVGLAGAARGPLPERPVLELATLVDRPPSGDAWIHEIKFDGYRIAARLSNGSAELLTRNGLDWTGRFPEIAAAVSRLPAKAALLDGEVVALDARGVSTFSGLQVALSGGSTGELVYQAFDLLHLDGYDLTSVPLSDRKALLARLLDAAPAPAAVSGEGAEPSGLAARGGTTTLRFSEHLNATGPTVFDHACRLHLEGIVSKRRDAPYRGGRSKRWLKSKCLHEDDFVIGGYTPPRGERTGFGALLLGAFADGDAAETGRLRYVGKVGTGFDEARLASLKRSMDAVRAQASPFTSRPPDARTATWLKPELVAEVRYGEWTHDGRLRQARFRGLREDKEPQEVTMAALGRTDTPREDSARKPRERAERRAEVAGVALSNAQRVLYPEQGVTKEDLANYYVAVAEPLLAYLAHRPLSLMRCPEGRAKQCFYQKHPGGSFPSGMDRVTIEESDGPADYLVAHTISDVVQLVQNGVLELHVWGCQADAIETPDLMVFDLDPAPGVDWSFTKRTTQALRALLEELGLPCFLRTTGGKGLHVVVPIVPERGWEEVKAFAKGIAERLEAADPSRLTTNMSKAKRKGKVFIDYLRNGRGSTAIANYSTRARAGAPVAVPLRWDELAKTREPDAYDVTNLPRRLAALKADPWDGFESARTALTHAMFQQLGLEAGTADHGSTHERSKGGA